MLLENLKSMSNSEQTVLNDGVSSLSFSELWHDSEAIARYLKSKESSSPVVIFGDKENAFVCCIIGCIKARRTYIPIPSYYPQERVKMMVDDSGADCFFNLSKDLVDYLTISIVDTAQYTKIIEQDYEEDLPESEYSQPGDTICILYTSGSSGIPKGVKLSYENIAYTLHNQQPYFKYNAPFVGCRCINFGAYSFSASLPTLYYNVVNHNATMYSIPRKLIYDYRGLMAKLQEIRPHRIMGTSTLMQMLLRDPQFDQEHFSEMRFIVLGGEPLSVDVSKKLMRRFPGATLVNGYGTTETGSGPLRYHVTPEELNTDEVFVPVGEPSPGTKAWLLDENGKIITEDNVPGELVLSGDCISKGYLNRPELTEKVFKQNAAGELCYYPKDIAKRIKGQYYILGRKDNQVKIGGNRIELEDIEANMKTLTQVKDCAVAVKEGKENSLIAFVIPANQEEKKVDIIVSVKRGLKDKLLSYMIPQKIILVGKLPRNVNLKLDRAVLKKMAQEN